MATAGQVEAKTQASQERQSGENRPAGANAQGDGRNAGGGGQGQGGRGGFANMTPEERQKRMEERMASMTPEEKAAFQERMKERMAQGGGRGGFGGAPGGQGANAGNVQRSGGQGGGNVQRGDSGQGDGRTRQQDPPANRSKSAATTSATTIDSLFAPLPVVETRQRAWLYMNKQLKPVNLRLGISDGTYTEVLNDTELPPEAELVTSIVTAAQATTPANQQNNANGNPLMPQRGRPGGPGGGGGGGGRGGGR